jgi:predicted porin
MKQLQKYLVLALLAVPLVGFTGGAMTNSVIKPNEAVASPALKKGSSAKLYGRLWSQYSNTKSEGSEANTTIFDDEGMGRIGFKGKSSIGNGYSVNYKVEWAIDLGDGDSSGLDREDVANSADPEYGAKAAAFTNKQSWLGLLTPYGQFKFGSMESPYKFLAKHDILHDTLAQMRDTRGISQGAMSHSGYWRTAGFYELKAGNFRFGAIKGFSNHDEAAYSSNNKKDYGYGLEYKNLGIKGLNVVYAMNHDHSGNEENQKYTITYKMKLGDKQKMKVWYMHENVELDTKLFYNGNGQVDWYGVHYSSGPMKLQYSYANLEDSDPSKGEGSSYNIGMQYKLSKTSRFYAGYSDYDPDADTMKTATGFRTYIFGLRHDF